MSIYNQPVNISLEQDYNAMDFFDRYFLQQLVIRRPQFTSMSYLTSKLAPPIMVDKFLIKQPVEDIAVPTVQCASTSLSTDKKVATITLQGSSRDILASDYLLTDSVTGVSGKILSHSASTVTLTFFTSPIIGATTFTTSDFASGVIATQSQVAMIGYNDKRTTESQYYLPQTRDIQIATFTRSVSLFKQDMIEKNRILKLEKNGMKFFAWRQVEKMLSEYASGFEKLMLTADQKIDETGKNASFAGLHWQIKNEGGKHLLMSNKPGEAELIQTIDHIRNKRGKGGDILLCGGTQAIGSIQQSVGNKFIPYAGNANTFGVKEGINVKSYSYQDCTIHIYTDFNDYNHEQWFPERSTITNSFKQQSAFMAFDVTPVTNDLGEKLPFLSNYCYGLPSDKTDGSYQVKNGGNIDGVGTFPTMVTGDTPEVTYMIHQTAAPTFNLPQNQVYAELIS